jgi:hypothetical protein
MNYDEFLSAARLRHGDTYQYPDLPAVILSKDRIQILCATHGLVYTRASRHMAGSGCGKCASLKNSGLNVKSLQCYRDRTYKQFGDQYVLPGQTDYTYERRNTRIVCRDHGEFITSLSAHYDSLRGGCPACNIHQHMLSLQSAAASKFQQELLYDLPQLGIGNVLPYCEKHGWLSVMRTKQYLDSKFGGCKSCAAEYAVSIKLKDTQHFVRMSEAVHGERYDYSASIYVGSTTPIAIVCRDHGEFWQLPNHHYQGMGCYRCVCVGSRGEQELCDYVNGIVAGAVEQRVRGIIPPMELDIVVPGSKTSLEFHGLYWHSEAHKAPNYHADKRIRAAQAGYNLIQIFEDEWERIPHVVRSMLNHKLQGPSGSRYYARQCAVRAIPYVVAAEFLDSNHMQGRDYAAVRYGLYFTNELLAVMTFDRPNTPSVARGAEWELSRYAVRTHHAVVGGFSKMLRQFERDYTPTSLKTYADLRYSTGDVYRKHGFVEIGTTKPNYWYFKPAAGLTRFHRFGFRKSKLSKKLQNYNPALTERENMRNHGWLRIYDAGNLVFRRQY